MTAALAAPVPLRDGDVSLELLTTDVATLLVAASHDEEITRWTQVPSQLSMLEAALVTGGWASNPTVIRLVVALPDLPSAGMVTVWVNVDGEAEVGYWLLEPARGRGVARRAVRLLSDWAFATCGLDVLQLTTMLGNTRSERVAQACGFGEAGTVSRSVKGSPCTMRLWVRSRNDVVRADI